MTYDSNNYYYYDDAEFEDILEEYYSLNYSEGYIYVDNGSDYDYEISHEIQQFKLERYIVSLLFIFIFLIGVLGNTIVIYIVVKHPNMKTVTNIYLANLAVVDLVFLFICVPLTSAELVICYWPFGLFLCRFMNYVQSVSLSVSVLTLTATSVDRFFAIVYPVRSRTARSLEKAKTVIIIIWCLSLTIMIPRVFMYQEVEYLNIEIRMYCERMSDRDNMKIRQIDTILMFVLMFLLPQIFLGIFHARIVKQLWSRGRTGLRSSGLTPSRLKTRRKVAKILSTITLAFGVGWLPLHIVRLCEDFMGSGDIQLFRNRELFALCFSFGANSVNPIIYTLISSKFRENFKAVICRNSSQNIRRTVPALPGIIEDPLEDVPLRLESLSLSHNPHIPQPRAQHFIYPSTSHPARTERSSGVRTVNLAQSSQCNDLTTVV